MGKGRETIGIGGGCDFVARHADNYKHSNGDGGGHRVGTKGGYSDSL